MPKKPKKISLDDIRTHEDIAKLVNKHGLHDFCRKINLTTSHKDILMGKHKIPLGILAIWANRSYCHMSGIMNGYKPMPSGVRDKLNRLIITLELESAIQEAIENKLDELEALMESGEV